MPKPVKSIVLHNKIREWGLTPCVSTAVPVAASGVEIQSTREVSNAMYGVLRKKVNENLISEVRRLVTVTKNSAPKNSSYSGTFFKANSRAPRSPVSLVRKRR